MKGAPSSSDATILSGSTRRLGGTAFQPAIPEHPLVLGVVVPRTGPLSTEGAEVVRAVEEAAAEANESSGVDAAQVTVEVVYTEDERAISDLSRRFDALVGGFGEQPAPPGITWLLPADTLIAGPNVIPGEVSARSAGALLGADLVARGFSGTVGAIQGDGPEAALADGLASSTQTLIVHAGSGSSCDREIFELRGGGVGALALAGSPELVTACVQAAQRAAWRPEGGLLVPPSAAYDRLPFLAWTLGIRTVLGFPWPTASDPGAAKFDEAVPGSRSYRALVSFAAAELAIQVARSRGSLSPSVVSAGTWRSDLYWFERGVNRNAKVVDFEEDGWTTPDTPHD